MMGFADDLETETSTYYRCRVKQRADLMGDDGPLLLEAVEDLGVPMIRVLRACKRNTELHKELPIGQDSLTAHRRRACNCFDE